MRIRLMQRAVLGAAAAVLAAGTVVVGTGTASATPAPATASAGSAQSAPSLSDRHNKRHEERRDCDCGRGFDRFYGDRFQRYGLLGWLI
ncbi:hypothetical protein ACFC0M_24890 [Streptomyces sp. NPDC056149]|uniref:hypothetical protein n=1 Tax=unclassified Streptomyces TaxID=2593676 RepID=UPI0023812EEB|nr:hypothetical protein [Streptomyces sp. WZ-12]